MSEAESKAESGGLVGNPSICESLEFWVCLTSPGFGWDAVEVVVSVSSCFVQVVDELHHAPDFSPVELSNRDDVIAADTTIDVVGASFHRFSVL